MERRTAILTGAATLLSVSAGCLSSFSTEFGDPEKVDFPVREGSHLLVVENHRERPVAVTLSTTDKECTLNYSNELQLEAGGSAEITELFTHGKESYAIRLVAEDLTIEKTIQMGGMREKSLFRIRPNEIEHLRVHRPTPHISVSNRRETPADFWISYEKEAWGESPMYDTLTLPGDGFESFTDLFSDGDEYEVTVKSDGMTTSTSHRYTITKTLTITLDDELEIVKGQR